MTDTPALQPLMASTLHLPPGQWLTVFDCLCEHFAHISRAQWQSRFERGRVLDASGAAIGIDTSYRAGLMVRYFREISDEPVIPFQETILYQDDHLVVADKPHFLPVTPKGQYVTQTLLHRLMHRLNNPQLAPLHRIDRGTAGLVMFSTNPTYRAQYHALFSEHRITKQYQALAAPLPQLEFPHVHRSRLVAGEPFFRMQEVPGEPNSETHIDVLERGEQYWRYALTPITGKKHQLRVHMAALGAPIIGDDFYPDVLPRTEDYSQPLKLLAASVAFIDPVSGTPRTFHSQLQI